MLKDRVNVPVVILIIKTFCTAGTIIVHYNRQPYQHNTIQGVFIRRVSKPVCIFSAACVNCVRWSNNGLYLASGGDDKLVMVWKRAAYVHTNTYTQCASTRDVFLEGETTFLSELLDYFHHRMCSKFKLNVWGLCCLCVQQSQLVIVCLTLTTCVFSL